MSKTAIKEGLLSNCKPLRNYLRCIYSNNSNSISWNTSLPLRVNAKGVIKDKSITLVIDDLRNSYGVDLTLGINLEKDCVSKEKENLKKQIKKLKDIIQDNPKDYESKDMVKKIKEKLSLLQFSNATYTGYCLRKEKFNYSKLDKLLASFLLVTGQVRYDIGKEKFVYELSPTSLFYSIKDFKSFNALGSFNQMVFKNTYYINAENAKILKKTGCSISEYLQKNKDALNSSDIKFNSMYKKVLHKKIKKMYPLLKKKDVKNILKSLYEFRVNLIDSIERNKKETEQNNLKDFSIKIGEAIKSSPIERKQQKKALVDSFIKCFPKTKLGKREVNAFIDTLMSIFDGLLREVEKNYIKRSDVEKEYIKKEEVEKNYVTKEEYNKLYTDYTNLKEEHNKLKEEHNKLMLKCDKLQKTVDELRAKLDKVTSNG